MASLLTPRSIVTPFMEQTLNHIVKQFDLSKFNLNNLCNGNYIYTLSRYKELLLQITSKLNISPDIIDEYLLNLMKTEYFPEVVKRIEYIESIPLIEQKTPEWFKQRETMISASDAGYFLKKGGGVSKAIDALKIKVGLKSYCNSSAPPLMHGNTYEDVSRAIYESRNCVSVTEYGILSSPTPCVGASPDGIVTKCHKDTYECQIKFGRLLEIKNPYSRIIDNTVKPEYMVQILQQQYTTQLPICDFVETTIVDAYCNTNNSNYKPYMNLADMLEDKLDKTRDGWEKRIKNKNISNDNLNKFGNEKGLLIWYKKKINDNDIRNKYVLYPLTSEYEKLAIEKWIVDTNSEYWKQGFQYVCTKFWRLDVYCEKTVVYDQALFEDEYVPELCKVWDVITKCNEIRANNANIDNVDNVNNAGNSNNENNEWECINHITIDETNLKLTNFIEELEKNKDSPFYNENKRKKKVKTNEDVKANSKDNSKNYPDKEIIELDF